MLTIEQMQKDVMSTWFGVEGEEAKGYVGLCLAGEVGELCNNLKKELRSKQFREDKGKEIDSEIPDIDFYLLMLKKIRADKLGMTIEEYNEMIWDRKMFHNTIKYRRSFSRGYKYTCDCERCKSWKIEGIIKEANGIVNAFKAGAINIKDLDEIERKD